MSDFNCFLCDSKVLEFPVIACSFKSNRENMAQFENRIKPRVHVSKKGGKDQELINQVPHLTKDTTSESDKKEPRD